MICEMLKTAAGPDFVLPMGDVFNVRSSKLCKQLLAEEVTDSITGEKVRIAPAAKIFAPGEHKKQRTIKEITRPDQGDTPPTWGEDDD
jgi:hypothetical protein